VFAENNISDLTGWLRHTAEQVENIHTAFTIERKTVHPAYPAENKLSSNIKANIYVKRLSDPFSKSTDFEAQGQIDYHGQEEKNKEHIARTIIFTYNSFTKKGFVDMNKKETDLGSFALNTFAKGLAFLSGGKLAFSLREFLEQKPNPKDEIQQLIHQLLFFGNIPIPDTNPWKLPEVFENLSSTVIDPEHDFARFNADTLSADIKNGYRSKALFHNKNSLLALKAFVQKQPVYKVDHPDFNIVPYHQFTFASQGTFFNIP